MKIRVADMRGLIRLAVAATSEGTAVVEAVHDEVTSPPFRPDPEARTRGVTGLVYRVVGGVTTLVGSALDRAFGGFELPEALGAPVERGAVVAALNGVVGDFLAVTDNPLAIQMTLRPRPCGSPARDRQPAASEAPVVVLVHGLCMNGRQWRRGEHDHGAALARDLGCVPLYLDYNSGLHVSTNGRALADLLERVLAPCLASGRQLVIVGHSMGGLVARSACHVAARARHGWLRHLRKIVFLGTPHRGAPLERGGNWVSLVVGAAPYAAPLARLSHMRSAGITDLRYGYLRDEDWSGRDRFARSPEPARLLPLPAGVRCFAMAAAMGQPDDAHRNRLLGDGVVPLASALGHDGRPEHRLGIPASNQWIGYGMNHLDLLGHPEVYARLRAWIAQ